MTSTEFAYKKIIERPRTTALARLFVWIGTHSVLSGFLGGICVVLFAMGSAFEGVKKAPTQALIISALVVLAWTILVGLMGKFFVRQGMVELEVHRAILAGEALFRWRENAGVLLEIEQPTYEIVAAPGLSLEEKPSDAPSTVYLKVEGQGKRFVLETQITRAEASQYEELPSDHELEVDEAMPIALASRVLLYAERKAG